MTTVTERPPARLRSPGLDALRGLAVLAMLVDHLALLVGADLARLTVGRLAMPLFFIVGGHLAGRLSPRLLLAAGLGLALPTVAPWIDSPNVLLLYAAGAVLLALGCPPVLLVAVALTGYANGWTAALHGAYEPAALLALMGVGQLLPRSAFAGADRLPSLLRVAGRYPLTIYAGHVLALTALTRL